MASASATQQTPEKAAASATQQTPEPEQELAEQGLRPTDPTEERREALEELRRRFDAVDSQPLNRLREDVAVPRTTDQLHVYFKQMQDEHFYYPHSQLACSTIEPLLPDHLRYVEAHREDFNFYEDYIHHYWGNFYSVFDSEAYTDLASDFARKGFYFKYHFEPFSKLYDGYYDYCVVLTEKEYELFHFTGILTPNLQHRQGVLNLHCGDGCLKHAFYMYLANSHEGRRLAQHYVIHFRLSLTLIA